MLVYVLLDLISVSSNVNMYVNYRRRVVNQNQVDNYNAVNMFNSKSNLTASPPPSSSSSKVHHISLTTTTSSALRRSVSPTTCASALPAGHHHDKMTGCGLFAGLFRSSSHHGDNTAATSSPSCGDTVDGHLNTHIEKLTQELRLESSSLSATTHLRGNGSDAVDNTKHLRLFTANFDTSNNGVTAATNCTLTGPLSVVTATAVSPLTVTMTTTPKSDSSIKEESKISTTSPSKRDIKDVESKTSQTLDRCSRDNDFKEDLKCTSSPATVDLNNKDESMKCSTSPPPSSQQTLDLSNAVEIPSVGCRLLAEMLNTESDVSMVQPGSDCPPPTPESPLQLLILDCRPFVSYNANHIRGALNVSCADCITRKRMLTGKASLGDLVSGSDDAKETYRVAMSIAQSVPGSVQFVVYDDDTRDFNTLPPVHSLRLVVSCLLKGSVDVYFLQGNIIITIITV